MSSLDAYKVPRESVNVDALVDRACYYLRMTAEDTEYLHHNATRRDEIIAELYARPGLKPFLSPASFVPEGGNPDDHLIPADAAIAQLTPPKSLEDRVSRLHLAAAAMIVFNQYKVIFALADHPDLSREYRIKRTQRMQTYYKTEFACLFPQSMPARLARQRLPDKPPTRAHLPSPPATPSSPRPVSTDDINRFISDPNALVGRQFTHDSPDEVEDEEKYGTWYVVSYTVRVAEHGVGVENEYQVAVGALGGAPIPMGPEEIRHLLEHSVVAV